MTNDLRPAQAEPMINPLKFIFMLRGDAKRHERLYGGSYLAGGSWVPGLKPISRRDVTGCSINGRIASKIS